MVREPVAVERRVLVRYVQWRQRVRLFVAVAHLPVRAIVIVVPRGVRRISTADLDQAEHESRDQDYAPSHNIN